MHLQWNKKGTLVHLFFLFLFVALSVIGSRDLSIVGKTYYWTWFLTGVLCIASSALILLPGSYFFKHPKRYLFFPAILISLSKLIGIHLFAPLWEPTGRFTGMLCFKFLSLFIPGLTTRVREVGAAAYTHISHPVYTIAVGNGCSGLEGVFFFIGIWCFVFLFDEELFSKVFWAVSFFAGLLFMYTLNIIRISLFYGVTFLVMKIGGQSTGMGTHLIVFHDAIGWCLYAVGLYYFYKKMASFGKSPLQLEAA
jgi:exosortase/archaeosortase family protein